MSGILLAHRAASGAKAPIVLPTIGDPFMGGFYAGIIDTTKSNIIAADASQSGLRYALIVAPKTLEATGKVWKNATSAGPLGVRTRWDGFGATSAMNAAGAEYAAAQYCWGLTYPVDSASRWYLPAMDEFEIIYRNLRPTAVSNYTASTAAVGIFPPTSQPSGVDPSSDPTGSAHTSSVPAQTSVVAFRAGGAQALVNSGGDLIYLTATEYDNTQAWTQRSDGSVSGAQFNASKTNTTLYVRPVRRLVLP